MNKETKARAAGALIDAGWEQAPPASWYGDWARQDAWGRDADRRYVIRIFGGHGYSTWRGEVELAGGGGYTLPFEAGEIPCPNEVLDIAQAAVIDARDRLCQFEGAVATG